MTPPAGVTPDANELIVINVDDSRKFSNGYQFTGDEQSISVPAGHYIMVDEAVSAPATRSDPYRDWTAFLTDFTVTGDGQTATIDTSAATASPYPSFSVPRSAKEKSMNLAYGITDDRGQLAFNLDGWRQRGVQEYVAPAKGGPHGKLSTVAWAELTSPSSASSPYTYYVAQGHENAVAGDEQVPVSRSELATVQTHYYGDGRPMAGHEGRTPAYPYLDPGFIANVPTSGAPAVRTEYVYNSPGATWMTDTAQEATDGSSVIEELTQPAAYQAGRTYREDYFRGPHAPGAFSEPGIGWPYCQACRTDTTMQLGVATFTDSDPTHYGLAYGTQDAADQHMTVRQDGTVIFDQDYAMYGRATPFGIASGAHRYQVTGSYDGAVDGQALSPHATTEWDFSTSDADRAAPSEWVCAGHPSTPCDVLPMMAVSYAMPTSPTGTMPPGTASFVVHVGHLAGAARTGITGLLFAVAADGSDPVPQQVQPLGGGRYRVTVDNPAVAAGTGMTVTVHATDAAGGSITQTVQTAYTISGS